MIRSWCRRGAYQLGITASYGEWAFACKIHTAYNCRVVQKGERAFSCTRHPVYLCSVSYRETLVVAGAAPMTPPFSSAMAALPASICTYICRIRLHFHIISDPMSLGFTIPTVRLNDWADRVPSLCAGTASSLRWK
jgi:hypothetical protein